MGALAFLTFLLLCKISWAGWGFCPEGSDTPCTDSNQFCGPKKKYGPQFHFRDLTCGMNDPNGPFYDPTHGLYHLFYQDHIGRPISKSFPQGFEGPSWGHGVSPDLVHWANLPVALWNGEDWYDVHALFTGSATIVNGTTPVLVFPGVCDMYPPAGNPGCRYGYTFGVAFPSNTSDPFLRKWSKSTLNPIVNDTFDDPSTAWMTPSGEFRWIANCGDGQVGDCGPRGNQAPLYGASDSSFSSAYKIGFTNLDAGECPSLFPLPPLTPGTAPVPDMPTHVHKWGCKPYKDCVELGIWREGDTHKREVGRWTRVPGTKPVVMDQGSAYAAKDFENIRSRRRVSIAWARLQPTAQGQQINGDVQTLAREMTYHPVLKQLVFSPLAKQSSLRGDKLGASRDDIVSIAKPLTLGPWPHGNQSDIIIHVTIPRRQATLYVSITAAVRVKFYIDFQNPPSSSTPWTEVEVGMLTDDPYPSIKDTLRLLHNDTSLELRLFLDHEVVEAYWQGGRVAMTVSARLTQSTAITLATDTVGAQLHVSNVTAWEMGSAWVTAEEALEMVVNGE